MFNRPPYSASRCAIPPPDFCPASTDGRSSINLNQNLASSLNTVNQRIHGRNTQAFRNNCMPLKPNIYGPYTVNNNSNSVSQPPPPPPRFGTQGPQYYTPHPSNFQNQPNLNHNSLSHSGTNFNITPVINLNVHQSQSVGSSNFPENIRNEIPPNSPQVLNAVSNTFSNTFKSSPQTMMPSNTQSSCTINIPTNNLFPSAACLENSANSQFFPRMLPSSANTLPPMQNSYNFPFPPPVFISNDVPPLNLFNELKCEKEIELDKFLSKFSTSEEKKESQITIPEYRSVLKAAFSLLKLLVENKCKLINADENEWNSELETVLNYQKQLSEICSLISAPVHLNAVMKKLKFIKRKKELKKKTKHNKLSQKIKMDQHRKELNQEIDKYLDGIKEKILKMKREAELKKEADYILLEVRKKIHEASRTIEKIKVFEKLRSARQANSFQKGLYVPPEHNVRFEKKVASLKETMFKQLADYEAEERALKVMLETEQEGQLEEENKWKLKKLKTVQEKKKNHIIDCLFGNSEDPQPTDPMFLFHKYQNSANNSIESVVQIRQQWDIYLSEEGEAVPHQWIAPVAPSNSSWEPWSILSAVSKS